MKKYLSLVLAIMMVLSCTIFAAPSKVGTVDTTAETTIDASETFDALVAEEASSVTTDIVSEKTVLHISFDGLTTIATADTPVANVADVVCDLPASFPSDVKFAIHGSSKPAIKAHEDGSGNYLEVTPNGSNYTRFYIKTGSTFPDGSYRLEADVKASTDGQAFSVNTVTNLADNVSWGSFNATTSFATYKKGTTFISGTSHNGATALKQIQIYIGNSANVWGVDNIKLIYKPISVKVNFAGLGRLPAAIDVAKGGKLVPSEFAPVSIPDTKEAFLGWSLTEGGEIVTEPFTVNDEITLYANYSDKNIETTSQYGKLAYFVDFDVASGTKLSVSGYGKSDPYEKFTTYTAPKINGMPDVVKFEGYNVYSTDGDNLVFTGAKWTRFHLVAQDTQGNEVSFPKGVYTFEYDAKSDTVIPAGAGNTVTVRGINYYTTDRPLNATDPTNSGVWPEGVGEATGFGALTANYKTYVRKISFDGKTAKDDKNKVIKSNVSGISDMETGGGMSRMGVYLASGSYPEVPRRLKYVKIWYAPLTIKLTLDANGKDVTVPETAEVSSTVKYSDYKLSDCGTSRFVGWSETKDGDLITDASNVYNEDTTLYAVWDDNYYATADEEAAGELLIHLHYNNSSAANLHSDLVNFGKIGSAFSAMFEGYTGNQKGWLQGSSTSDRIFTTKYGTPESHKHADNEFWITSVKQGINYPKLNIGCAGGHLANGIYTLYVEVSVHDVENISRIGYNVYTTAKPVSTNNQTDVVCDESNLPTDGQKYYVKKTVFVKDGYFGDYESGRVTYIVDDSTSSKIGFNFNIVPADETVIAKATIHCDNFKIYYREYTGAPKSYKENSIRVDNPSGIRFKSSVGEVERSDETLAEYGFIVALKKTLDAAGVAPENFTMESDVKYVKGVNYGEVNGEKIDKIFATKNSYTYFTAIIYNIPADRYGDDLVVVPYIKIGGKTVYGEPMINNILDVANALKDSEFYEENKDAIDNIIAGKEIA